MTTAERMIPAPILEATERYARLLWRDGDVREVRIPKAVRGRTHAGYFDDPAALAAAAASWDGRANVYLTINPVRPALLARASGRIAELDTTTSDVDVLRRSWLYIDLDAVRPSGISSSDDELAAVRRPEPAIRLLSVEQAAEQAGVGRSYMYEAIARGQVRSVKLGRRRLVPSDALDELIERNAA